VAEPAASVGDEGEEQAAEAEQQEQRRIAWRLLATAPKGLSSRNLPLLQVHKDRCSCCLHKDPCSCCLHKIIITQARLLPGAAEPVAAAGSEEVEQAQLSALQCATPQLLGIYIRIPAPAVHSFP